MPKVQDFLEAAKGAIVSGSYDRAIALCQDVLARYPKHIEAHCLLAEAFREHGEGEIAEDFFCRVLSADPENLIARWALSVLHQQRGEHDAALAQLRLALEMNPDHGELRKEVIKQSGDRVKTTTPGLARLYMRGALFDLAAAEFRAALRGEPKRLDLMVGLAEAEWCAGNGAPAAAICRQILEESPDCLKALLIAACVAASADQPLAEPEAKLWEQVHALDPENVRTQDLLANLDLVISPDRWAIIHAAVDLPAPQDATLLSYLPIQSPRQPAPTEHPRVPSITSSEALTRTDAEAAFLPDSLQQTAVIPAAHTVAAPLATNDDALVPELSRAVVDRSVAALDSAMPAPVPVVARGALQEAVGVPEGSPVVSSDNSWLAENAPGQSQVTDDVSSDATDWGEWASLLAEDITLDPEAEARLAAALADVNIPPQSGRSAQQPREGASGSADAASRQLSSDVGSPLHHLIEALDLNPADHAARLGLAKGYQQFGQVDAAIEQYRTLVRVAPELGGEIADSLREFLLLHPDHAEIHRALGDAYMKIGRFQQAIDEYNRGLSLEKAVR